MQHTLISVEKVKSVHQPVRKTIAIVNKNGSNNYQSTPRIVSANHIHQSGHNQNHRSQPVYATLNTVRQEGGQGQQQTIRTNGPIRSVTNDCQPA